MISIWSAVVTVLGLFVLVNAVTFYFTGRIPLCIALGVGASMEPTITRGLTLTIAYYPFSIEEGDVIMWVHDSRSICHRVVLTKEDTVVTKGDANRFRDEPVPKSSVTGKIVSWNEKPLYLPVGVTSIRRFFRRQNEA